MHKNKTHMLIICAAIAVGVLIVVHFFYNSERVSDGVMTAKVTNVVDVPNRAEDGYYAITVQDESGQTYTINATGYRNTPLKPVDNGEACVDVPKVAIGNTISFHLPIAPEQENTFMICRTGSVDGYFLKIN